MITLLALLAGLAAAFWWAVSLGKRSEIADAATIAARKQEADAHALTVYVDERAAIEVRAEAARAKVAPADPADLAAAARARDELERLLNGGRVADAGPPPAPPGAPGGPRGPGDRA